MPVLANHRRGFMYAIGLLAACVVSLVAVGRHAAAAAPDTTLPLIGHFDASVYRWMDDIRSNPVTAFFRFLNVAGGGIVTIPLRAVASIVLAFRRELRRLGAFVLTWVASELLLDIMKAYFHRGRPPGPLVATTGYSFPSGHAVAAAATAVALVLAFIPAGSSRRKWEWIAVAFSFVMAFSRVYLNAHWFSDVVAAVLLGSGIAIGSAALVTEVRNLMLPEERESQGPPEGGRRR